MLEIKPHSDVKCNHCGFVVHSERLIEHDSKLKTEIELDTYRKSHQWIHDSYGATASGVFQRTFLPEPEEEKIHCYLNIKSGEKMYFFNPMKTIEPPWRYLGIVQGFPKK